MYRQSMMKCSKAKTIKPYFKNNNGRIKKKHRINREKNERCNDKHYAKTILKKILYPNNNLHHQQFFTYSK